ncbi:DeoR family transcriptional regulator [Roseibium hamelinense]|uniref:DeoR family transcriptional regulator n=1 Tax=Roseibium hamelinense TaxID=150831 RepID=A0A562SMR1_9HYPH|nr:DeoR/GlpR family DNA-binding transcription regulator [Roseibium hamelinense]MTI44943.1 DeoR/GlpR transcriptional regulator [Roseibium hamelinense]TWI82204.1 DeoR family transcriptional regulator [Roseibium hamelinense]
MLIARHNAILEIARQNGRVSVDDLSRRFDVSPQTIRKDLNELCERRLLARTHGGALLSSGIENVGYEARRIISSKEKADIGTSVATLIPDNASMFINIGTTTEAVAQSLLQHRGLMVITNNLNVASLVRGYSQIEVVVAGGVLRHADGGIVGEAAVDFMRQFKVDFAIVGASAIDPDGSLLDYDYREVRVTQTIMENARHVILAADSTKFERTAPVRVGHLSQVTTFVTDNCPSDTIRQIAANEDVTLIETGVDRTAVDQAV